jgi:endonuclease III
MVRGPDRVDFGIWKRVSTSQLIIPLDTHIARIARYLGLTRRKDSSWTTAEEITMSLRRVDPVDPVRFDFALCHHGMSGACPLNARLENCSACALLGACSRGNRVAARHRTAAILRQAAG